MQKQLDNDTPQLDLPNHNPHNSHTSLPKKSDHNVISIQTIDTPKSNSHAEGSENNLTFQAKNYTPDVIESPQNELNNNDNKEEIQKDKKLDPQLKVDTTQHERSPRKKQTTKFISHSFKRDNDSEIQEADILEEDSPDYIQLIQRPCLKQTGKFMRSQKKKRSRSFSNDSNHNNNDTTEYEALKQPKVNFNQQVRVKRVTSYKAYNILEDELKNQINKNRRLVKEEAKQQSQRGSRQMSMVDAFGNGSNNNQICCNIF